MRIHTKSELVLGKNIKDRARAQDVSELEIIAGINEGRQQFELAQQAREAERILKRISKITIGTFSEEFLNQLNERNIFFAARYILASFLDDLKILSVANLSKLFRLKDFLQLNLSDDDLQRTLDFMESNGFITCTGEEVIPNNSIFRMFKQENRSES